MAPPEVVQQTGVRSGAGQPIAQQPAAVSKGVHSGPAGTYLTGFSVKDLNDFHYATARTVTLPSEDPQAIANTKHTTQGVDVEPYTIVQGPQDWKAADFKGQEHKWQFHLTPTHIEEIRAALANLKTQGIKIEDIERPEQFPLPTLGPELVRVRDEVILGKGFHVIKGFPVHEFDRWETAATYYAFGVYWGKPQAQNAKGHTLGHIKAIGTDPTKEGVRPYTTNIAHGYHSDNSDIAALLCLQDAEEGGINNWVSSIAIHNALLRRGRKDLVEVLTTGFFPLPAHNVWGSPNDVWLDESGKLHENWISFPPFLYHDNKLSVTFKEGAWYYYYKFPDAPRFSPLQEEALRTFAALAMSDELRLDYKLQPGDISLVNNLTLLHAKTAFKDSTDPAKRRHLLRLWVAAPNAPALPDNSPYKATWGSVEVGNRGGYWLGHHYVKQTPLTAEYGDLEETRPKVLLE